MQKSIFRKGLIVGILILFFVAGITTNLSGKAVFVTNNKELKEKNIQIGTCNLDVQTFYPTDDTSVKEYEPNTNYGTSYLVVRNKYGGYGQPGYEDDLLIKFDISDITAGTIIVSATLNLYYNRWISNNPAGRTLTLYRVTSDWGENTVTWNTRPNYTPEVTSSLIVPGSPGVWMEWNVIEDVRAFVDGEETNYGWQIMDEIYWGTFDIPATLFHQKEQPGGNIAYLEIETEKGGNGFKTTFIFGKIDNLVTEEDIITFEAVNIRCIQFFPFGFIPYTSGELIIISEDYIGVLTPKFIFAVCGANI